MTGTAYEPDPDDAADDELAAEQATTLAKVNDDPPADDADAVPDERADTTTVLARMNDNPPREE